MAHAVIPFAVGRDGRQVQFSQFLWSSVPSTWSGFRLEKHRIGPRGHVTDVTFPHSLLGFCTGGNATIQFRSSGLRRSYLSAPGALVLLPDGIDFQALSWSGTRELLYVELDAARLDQLMRGCDDLPRPVVTPQFGIFNPQVSSLLLNMQAEVEAGCPAGSLYGESLSLALASYLLGRYSVPHQRTAEPRSTLSSTMRQRIVEYINTHLSSDLSLTELARVAELSPYHFAHLFKNTVGIAPHDYVVRERISESQNLLVKSCAPIVEIAVSLGFASQSHFTAVFRKLTGTTPKHFRQERSRCAVALCTDPGISVLA